MSFAQVHTDNINMPQNTDNKATQTENNAIAYKARLIGWAIVRVNPDAERVVVSRFRSRADADGYMRHLRQVLPNVTFEVVFDCQREEVAI
jgi:hypothetical protein